MGVPQTKPSKRLWFNVVVVSFPPFYYFVWEMLGEAWDTPPEQNVQGMNSGVVTW